VQGRDGVAKPVDVAAVGLDILAVAGGRGKHLRVDELLVLLDREGEVVGGPAGPGRGYRAADAALVAVQDVAELETKVAILKKKAEAEAVVEMCGNRGNSRGDGRGTP